MTGEPTCMCGSRWPRFGCPLCKGRVTGTGRLAEFGGLEDRACACGFVVGHGKGCVLAEPPATYKTQPPAAEPLPAGWRHVPADGYQQGFTHHSRADVFWSKSNGCWLVAGACTEHPSMLTAMAAALGIEVYEVKGDNWSGWCWKAPYAHSCDTEPDYRTADEAARAGLAAYEARHR